MAEWKKVVLDGAAASLASLSLTTDLDVTHGGTGASNASGARTNLGLVIGTNIQAQSAVLDDLNTLGAASADGEFIVATGAGAFAYESGATARTSMGAQAAGDVLDDLNTLGAPASDGQFIVATGAGAFAYESAATARTSMGAAKSGANSDITSITGLTTALSAGIGGTGLLQAALTAGTTGQVLALNDTKDGFDLVSASSGDITGVIAGTGLSGGGTSGSPTLDLALNSLTAANVDVANDSIAIIDANDSNAPKKEAIADLVNGIAGTNDVTGLLESSGTLNISIASLTNLGGATIAGTDEFMFSDAGTLKAVTFGNLEDTIFANITSAGGDVTAAAGGALTIGSQVVENTMLNSNIISAQTEVTPAAADFLLIGDTNDSNRLRKIDIEALVGLAPQGTVTSVAGGTGLTSTGGTTPSLSVDAAQTGITSMTGVNTINASGNALALGSSDSNVTVQGNLIVNGTASFEDAETLRIKDPMIILRSGSAGAGDGGFIVEQSGGETGQFFGYDASAGASGGRFGVVASVAEDATSVTISNFMPTVTQAALGGAPAGAPLYGGTDGLGNFAVDTTNHDLYVYVSS